MKENYFDKIELQSGTLMELLMSLLRIGMNNRYHELSKEYGLAIDEEIDSWVNEVLNTISTPMKDLLEFYFNDDGFLGLGLLFIVNELREQKNFENLIAYIEKLSPEKIGNYLLRFACEDKWRDDFFIFQHDEKLFDIITTYFSVSDEGKWRVFKILSKPKLIKKELLSLLRYYYNTFYKQKQSEVDQLINQCITHNEEKLKQSFINSLLPVLSKKITTDIFKERNPLIVHVSYFLEFGSSFFLKINVFLLDIDIQRWFKYGVLEAKDYFQNSAYLKF